ANRNREVADLKAQLEEAQSHTTTQQTATTAEDDEDPMATIAKLEQRAAASEAQLQGIAQQLADNSNAKYYADALNGFKAVHGDKYSNDAITYARGTALARGYTLVNGDFPPMTELCDLVEKGFMNARIADGKTAVPATKTKVPKTDTGRAGAAANTEGQVKGTPEEVLAAMKAEGRLTNLTVEE
ncbi:hypothetical protein LCGC14_3040270, partial [marine sediment metagenome]